MGRRPRVFVEGATYHVYARITRREQIFVEAQEAEAWVAVVREVKRRDGFAVLAWCLMSNHFHLLLRTGAVPLWRSMRSIQGRFAVGFNRRQRLVGPVWQTRYGAKVVSDDAYLRRVVAYIHTNPVTAGVAARPEEYTLSGHREMVGLTAARICDPDETMRLFGETRREARRAYRDTVRVVCECPDEGDGEVLDEPEAGGEGGEWRSGSPRRPGLDALGSSPGPWRPLLDAEQFVGQACAELAMDVGMVRGRQQGRTLSRAREAIALVGTERFALRLNALAAAMSKSAASASRWIERATIRRTTDAGFAELVDRLDRGIAARSGTARIVAASSGDDM
jgi:REP element-mobilizing transposase RayT